MDPPFKKLMERRQARSWYNRKVTCTLVEPWKALDDRCLALYSFSETGQATTQERWEKGSGLTPLHRRRLHELSDPRLFPGLTP